jgi:hypothetical protein
MRSSAAWIMGLLAFSLTVFAGSSHAFADGNSGSERGFNLGFDRGFDRGERGRDRWSDRGDNGSDRWGDKGSGRRRRGAAPEIDPVGLGSVASLLVGGGLLLGARRSPRRAADE